MAKNARAQAADAMTQRLADALGETRAERGLHYYAWYLGPECCEMLLQQALEMADSPDLCMWTHDGRRPRAAAGTFFVLARHEMALRERRRSVASAYRKGEGGA